MQKDQTINPVLQEEDLDIILVVSQKVYHALINS